MRVLNHERDENTIPCTYPNPMFRLAKVLKVLAVIVVIVLLAGLAVLIWRDFSAKESQAGGVQTGHDSAADA